MRTIPLTLAVSLFVLATGCKREETPAQTTTAPATTAVAASTVAAAPEAKTQAPADADMQAVLDKLASLGGKPVESLSPVEARKQPSPADAVAAVMKDKGIPAPKDTLIVTDRTFPGAGGPVKMRVYQPKGAGPFPVILYIHGGGWVIADLDTYDASPRGLASGTNAVVFSTHYRQAPAAHEDTIAAYKWVLANAGKFKGDAKRIALVGESAGGNMAANVAIAARDEKLQAPVRQVLVYPVANNDTNSPSYIENANAKPLNKPMMEWFVKQTFASPADAADSRIALAKRTDLAGVAPTTIVLAQIDPLRSEGEALAKTLEAAGVPVDVRRFDGVTHEFFGMGTVVAKAKQAMDGVTEQLKRDFSSAPPAPVTSVPAPSTVTGHSTRPQ